MITTVVFVFLVSWITDCNGQIYTQVLNPVYENTTQGTVLAQIVGVFSVDAGNAETRKAVNIIHTIEPTTWNITLNTALDVDYGTNLLRLMFNIKNSVSSDLYSINEAIFIIDVNDVIPQLLNQPFVAAISENAVPGIIPDIQIEALDPDEGEGGQVSFSLLGDKCGKFSIKIKVVGKGVNFILNGSLDFEETRFYECTIQVKDRGGLRSTAPIYITVEDVQDQPPLFTGVPYSWNVKENTPEESLVGTVKAMDGDRGIPNQVNYTITSDDCNGLFKVNSTSGAVRLIRSPDRDSGSIADKNGVCICQIMAQEISNLTENNTVIENVAVTIEDVNDNIPTFSNGIGVFRATIKENMPEQIPIQFQQPATMSVEDIDQTDNSRYNLTLMSYQEYFEVDPNTVYSKANIFIRVKNSSILDYEVRQNLLIEILAAETETTEAFSSTATINLTIIDTNDHSPVLHINNSNLFVDENSSTGTFIVEIKAADEDSNGFGLVTFSLTGGDNKFRINATSGFLSVSGDLDREKKDKYFVTVEAKDGGNRRSTQLLTININDKNDNVPIFQKSEYDGFVSENTEFTRNIQVTATDNDEQDSPNSNITYSLVSTSPAGLLDNFTISPSSGQLNLNGFLDYESLPTSCNGTIHLNALATDSGNPRGRSSKAIILITVTDINEYAPEFNQTSYQDSVGEDAQQGVSVASVSAFDADGSSPNNQISYSIISGGSDKFRINSLTGVIKSAGKLDRESKSFYSLIVLAGDRGTPGLSTSTVVNLTITDVNDAPPVFDISHKTIQVTENSTRSINNINVTDEDENSNLSYRIDWSKSSGVNASQQRVAGTTIKDLCYINAVTGNIILQRDMDREEFRQITLVLVVEDLNAATSDQTSTATLSIIVGDIDDNPPEFNRQVYTASIPENSPIDTPINFVNPQYMNAKDIDQGNNATFKIEIVDDDGTFTADPSRVFSLGSIIIKVINRTMLDYESRENMTFQIKAIPMMNRVSVTATIHLNIDNINEFPPHFVNQSYYVDVNENSTSNTNIIEINATDDDSGIFGQVSLSLSGESDLFGIHQNGQIYLQKEGLNRELKDTYYLTVEAIDGGGKRATTSLVINVDDINDEKPMFERREYSAVLTEGSSSFTRVLSVHATDGDKSNTKNSQIEYTIVGNQLSDNFTMNNSTGVISVLSPIDYERLPSTLNGTITLNIMASDLGTPTLSSYVNVSIKIEDVNDFSPVFENSTYRTSILENQTSGVLITVKANDYDASSPNKDVFYIIKSGGSDKFSINSSSGLIQLASSLDRETTNRYSIIINGVDRGTPSKTGTTTVVVTIADVNDEFPKFYPATDRISVNETSVTTKPLYTIRANDSDSNASLVYDFTWSQCHGYNERQETINSTYLQSLLKLDRLTGAITLMKDLDREIIQQIILQVSVSDQNGQQQTTTGSLIIDVLDINDNKPTFNNPTLTAEVTENMPVGIPLTFGNGKELIVTDIDKDYNSEFSLQLTEGEDIFEVVPKTVRSSSTILIKIQNNTKLDYEQYREFRVKVFAKETSTMELYNSTATINVKIVDTNDNNPDFGEVSYLGNVSENAAVGTFIVKVNATDADSGNYGNISYELQGGKHRFKILPTGDIVVDNAELDREAQDVYYLTILAVDEYGLGRRQTAPLQININDINDNAPVFTRDSYEGLLTEGEVKFERPVIVQAEDRDEENTVNSEITYHINTDDINSITNNFILDSITGELTLNGTIDYELLNKSGNGKIRFGIEARDNGVPYKSSNITYVTMTITDINDNTPLFTPVWYNSSIPENSKEGTHVATIGADDADGSSPNNVVFYLIETGGFDKFRMNSTSGHISVGPGSHLDRENTDTYKLTVLAVDRGTKPEPLSSSATVEIVLTDVNDEKPIFVNEAVIVDVLENLTIGSVVFVFNASDPDTNPSLQYEILWKRCKAYDEKDKSVAIEYFQNWFEIVATTGEIRVNSSMDRETAERIILYIFTQDLNDEVTNMTQTATGILTINIQDVNDNQPVVTEGSSIVLNVSESTSISTELTTLSATDKDKNQRVMFSINNTVDFNITANGKITLARVLDRENQSKVYFEVMVTDNGKPPQSRSVPVLVNVLDYNDNSPIFNMTATSFTVPENASNTTQVAVITTYDLDIGANSNITYSLSGEQSSVFRIDQNSGEIFVDKPLDREKHTSYTFNVQAKDNPVKESEKSNKATQTIVVIISDINDCTPKFEHQLYQVLIPETLNIGTVITSIQPSLITAKDQDDGINAKIIYSQNGESHLFNVSTLSGKAQLVVAENLRSLSGFYNLTVIATDQGPGSLQSNTSLVIEVQDENINTPQFQPFGQIPSIRECAKPGTIVYTFTATDADKEKKTNGKVLYKFENESAVSEDWRKFSLDKDSGNMTLATKLDRELQTDYTMRIIAYDLGLPERKSVTSPTITIHLTDVNDNPPTFNQTIQERTFRISENVFSIDIGNVIATDPDADAKIVYSIKESKWSSFFNINTTTSEIGVTKPIDRENSLILITLVVVADDSSVVGCDSNSTAYSSKTSVFIHILDVNDNAPKFTKNKISIGFRSTSDFGTVVIDMKRFVTDEDTAINSIHKYRMIGQLSVNTNIKTFTSPPVVLSENGTITTNLKFETSTVGRLQLTVVAYDVAGNDTVDLTLYIIGDKQVVKMTFLALPDEVRKFQDELVSFISNVTGIEFVADEILSHIDEAGNQVDYKTDIFLHGVDSESGEILDASILRSALDRNSAALQDIHTKYKVIDVNNVLKEKLSNDDAVRKKEYLYIGVIIGLVVVMIIIISVFLRNFSSFKRKLKAAKIDVKTSGKKNADEFSPVLHKSSYGMNNPIYEKDCEVEPPHFDSHSVLNDSLDVNEVNTDFEHTGSLGEEELSLDFYDEIDHGRHINSSAMLLNEVLNHQKIESSDMPSKSKQVYNLHNKIHIDDLETTDI